MVAGLLPLPTRCSTRCPRSVVLDPGGGLGCPESADAQQVGEGSVVHRQSLGNLEEADELKPVQCLGAGLVGVDLGQPGVDGRVGGDQAVDVRALEEPPARRAAWC